MTTSATRLTGALTVLSGAVALLSNVLIYRTVDGDFTLLEEPLRLFARPTLPVGLFRWSMLTDLLGYYLLLLPAIFYLHHWLRGRTAWRALLTFCASSYVLIGALGAAVLAAVGTYLLATYPAAPVAEQRTLQLLFQTTFLLVNGALWNLLEILLSAAWWVGLGLVLRRQLPALGTLTVVLGLSCLLDFVGNLLALPALASLGLYPYLLLAPVWALWLGTRLLRGGLPGQ